MILERIFEKEQIQQLKNAVLQNNLDKVKQLLENNEYSDNTMGEVLLEAISKRYIYICRYLVEGGKVNLNHPVKFASTTFTPLHWTSIPRKTDYDLTHYFVLHGVKPDAEALGQVIARGDIKLVQFLLDHKADPNGVSDGKSMLMIAKMWKHESVVQLLIQYGAE